MTQIVDENDRFSRHDLEPPRRRSGQIEPKRNQRRPRPRKRRSRYPESSASEIELDFAQQGVSTDSGTDMASPPPMIQRSRSAGPHHTNRAFVHSRSPSLTRPDPVYAQPQKRSFRDQNQIVVAGKGTFGASRHSLHQRMPSRVIIHA